MTWTYELKLLQQYTIAQFSYTVDQYNQNHEFSDFLYSLPYYSIYSYLVEVCLKWRLPTKHSQSDLQYESKLNSLESFRGSLLIRQTRVWIKTIYNIIVGYTIIYYSQVEGSPVICGNFSTGLSRLSLP